MARKRKIPKLTAEEQARRDETTRIVRARIAERERIEAARVAKQQSA